MIKPNTFPDPVWIVELRPTFCEHCGSETDWKDAVCQGTIRSWRALPDGSMDVSIVYGDYDHIALTPNRVYLTKEEAEAALVEDR